MEKCELRIEVFEDHLMIIFPRKMDNFTACREEMESFASILKRASGDIPPPVIVNPIEDEMQQAQIKINTHQHRNLTLLFHWTDRIKLGPCAAEMVAAAILLKCQELRYSQKGIHLAHGPAGKMYNRKFLGKPRKLDT